MNLSNVKRTAGALVLALLSTTAHAVPITYDVTLNFESGATFVGTITFDDSHGGMLDTDGYLTGGTNNYDEYMNWAWFEGVLSGGVASLVWEGDIRYDWLMNGDEGSNLSTLYIGLSWLASNLDDDFAFTMVSSVYHNGIETFNDRIISSTVSRSVPEPGTLALLGSGLLLMGALRRRRT